MTSLEELVLNENEIENIPDTIGFLRNLMTLILDSNQLNQIPSSLGSCIKLRVLSLAENELKTIPDEIGHLTNLRVLNLNSNTLTHLPFSLTKISDLQALWLSENQQKPLVNLQSDVDEKGQKVLTCFLLPQLPKIEKSPNSPGSRDDQSNSNSSARPAITFSNDSTKQGDEDQLTAKLIRNPTPYPKELKAHARHARNLALKRKDNSVPDVVETSNAYFAEEALKVATDSNVPKSSQYAIKSAVVTKSNAQILSNKEEDSPAVYYCHNESTNSGIAL